MNKIISKQQLADEVFRIEVEAPLIAAARQPGQFVIVQLDTNFGERIPLTIADYDVSKGTITLIFQTVGRSTHLLADLPVGASIANLVGPLGRPTHIEKFGTVVGVGGGIGVAPLHPIARAMKEAGNRLILILGARTKDLLIMETGNDRSGG
jgi:ferredoxin--NADP+ reductase